MSSDTIEAPGSAEISVLIARASTEDHDRILETLAALREQDCAFAYEVIVVDRLGDEITRRIDTQPSTVRLLRCPSDATLPEMRSMALAAARGRVVAVTEDHCVPCRGWLRAFDAAFRRHPQAVAVGGCVANGLTSTAFDWATYLCEYAAFAPPVAEGPQASLPGMNIAYLKSVLTSVPAAALTRGFWETTVHPSLLRAGHVFVSTGDALVHHRKRFSPRFFLAQRSAYSRYYAGIRFAPRRWHLRLAAALLCPLLPFLLAARFAAVARHNDQVAARALRALPWLALFYAAWAAGECAGYLAGPGQALRAIE